MSVADVDEILDAARAIDCDSQLAEGWGSAAGNLGYPAQMHQSGLIGYRRDGVL